MVWIIFPGETSAPKQRGRQKFTYAAINKSFVVQDCKKIYIINIQFLAEQFKELIFIYKVKDRIKDLANIPAPFC